MIHKLSISLTCLVLAACSGGGGGGNASYTPSGANSMGAVVATGAPLANVPYNITRLTDNAVVSSGTVGLDAYLQAQVSQTDAPFIFKVTDTGVTPNVEHENLVLPSDFGSDGKVNMNVTPISTIVTKIVRGQLGDLSKATVAELTTQRAAAADTGQCGAGVKHCSNGCCAIPRVRRRHG